jgi:hypothetical protein
LGWKVTLSESSRSNAPSSAFATEKPALDMRETHDRHREDFGLERALNHLPLGTCLYFHPGFRRGDFEVPCNPGPRSRAVVDEDGGDACAGSQAVSPAFRPAVLFSIILGRKSIVRSALDPNIRTLEIVSDH